MYLFIFCLFKGYCAFYVYVYIFDLNFLNLKFWNFDKFVATEKTHSKRYVRSVNQDGGLLFFKPVRVTTNNNERIFEFFVRNSKDFCCCILIKFEAKQNNF